MLIACATMFRDLPYIETWGKNHVSFTENQAGVTWAYQRIYEASKGADFIFYVHDDAECLEPYWQSRVEAEFEDPKVAIVGLGGAMGMGIHSLWKTPYEISQLQRVDYYSNQVGWEIHGKRETGSRNVAVVDGFAMAIRTSFLDQIGGWTWFPFAFHCYDTAMCLMAHRHGWKVRMVGVSCDHHGGGNSCSADYVTWCREHGTTPEREHREPHEWLAKQKWVKELLPLRVKP